MLATPPRPSPKIKPRRGRTRRRRRRERRRRRRFAGTRGAVFGAEAFGIDPAEGFVVDAVAITARGRGTSFADAARLADEYSALVERLRRSRDDDDDDSESRETFRQASPAASQTEETIDADDDETTTTTRRRRPRGKPHSDPGFDSSRAARTPLFSAQSVSRDVSRMSLLSTQQGGTPHPTPYTHTLRRGSMLRTPAAVRPRPERD